MKTFAEVIRQRAGDEGEALWFEDRSWSWSEVLHEACVRASLLQEVPLRPGRTQRHVGVLLQNVPDFVFWLLGAALSGDVVVGVNPTRRGPDLVTDVTHVECDVLISEPHHRTDLEGLEFEFGPDLVWDVESDTYRDALARHTEARMPVREPSAEDLFLLLFSSGSTGAPKAVICTQGRLGRLTDVMAQRISADRDSVHYMSLPLFHGHAIMMNLATAVHVGAKVVMIRKFSASRFIPDLRRHGVTFFNYVGRVLSYVLAQPEAETDSDNALRVVFGSEASPAEVAEFRRRFACHDVREGYGASEGVLRITPVPGAPAQSLGLPAGDAVVEVRDPETNLECPRARFDERGVLLNADEATGEMVVIDRAATFEGYYRNPEAMADRLRHGGRDFWTGDLAYRDENGYLYFAGRPADWLRVDGENLAVAPVERLLARCPQLAGAHAFGVPDPQTGDLLMAVVTPRPGVTFDVDSFDAFMAQQPDMGTKWRPTFVRVLDVVPTTANGKIDKAPLRAAAWEEGLVFHAPTRGAGYRILDDAGRDRIRETFVAGGRENRLPAVSLGIVLDERAVAQAADRLLGAHRTGVAAAPIREFIGATDIELAYQVQQRVNAALASDGARVIGRKIGLTSRAVQEQLGVHQPDLGVLFDDMLHSADAVLPVGTISQPKVEAEIAFVLGADLVDGDLSIAQVRDAVDHAVAAIEICGSRIRDWDISFADTVADNASSGGFVLGDVRRTLDEFEPRDAVMTMEVTGQPVSTGRGTDCLGDPLLALQWLAAKARELGEPLRAGQIVLSGALGPMRPALPGARAEVTISGLGNVSVTFGAAPIHSSQAPQEEHA